MSGVAWRTILGFKAFCILKIPNAYRREVFNAAYALRKTSPDACYSVPQGGCNKLNMVDIDYDMRETVVRVTGPWEAEPESECGTVSTTWNLGPLA